MINTVVNDRGDIETWADMEIGGVVTKLSHMIIRTQDAQVREALVKLGWTPPAEKA